MNQEQKEGELKSQRLSWNQFNISKRLFWNDWTGLNLKPEKTTRQNKMKSIIKQLNKNNHEKPKR